MNISAMNMANYPSAVFLVNIADIPVEVIESFLSQCERERWQRFRQPLDAHRYAVAHYLKRYVLSLYIDCSPLELMFDADVYGKPFCLNHSAPYFNLSHSQSWVAMAVSQLFPVGVDIEFPRNVDVDKVLKKISSNEQQARYKTSNDKKALFLRVWTQKEAVSKAYGQGIRCGLENIPCTGELGQHPLNCFGRDYYVYSEQMGSGGILSFVSSSRQLPSIIWLEGHTEYNENSDRAVVFYSGS